MGETTKIEWTDRTFNAWIGCEKVSPGCKNCYAEALDARWGRNFTERRRTARANWRKPLAWERQALELGVRLKVFCASLADVFDSKVPDVWRLELFDLVRRTPHLDWQLLTKRPENVLPSISAMIDAFPVTPDVAMATVDMLQAWLDGKPPANVWLGVSVENQGMALKRISELVRLPAAVRFLSVEPLLEAVDLEPWLFMNDPHDDGARAPGNRIHWVIVGGESGRGARHCDLAWIRRVVAQCRESYTPVFVKQLGSVPVVSEGEWRAGITAGPGLRLLNATNRKRAPAGSVPLKFEHKKGGDKSEWPLDLCVRDFPDQGARA